MKISPLDPKAAVPAINAAPAPHTGKIAAPAPADSANAQPAPEKIVELPGLAEGKLQLSLDRNTGRVVGRVVDEASGKIIRQRPSDEMLRFIAATEAELGPLYSVKA
tara:strand:+ start:611 stop:931 length:321 start_codon:yes stop_codon:yes gene_type:complete